MRIKFGYIQTEKGIGGGAIYESFAWESHFGRVRECPLIDSSSLLNESIRFYNYGLYSPMAKTVVEKQDWMPFDSKTVTRAIDSLYDISCKALLQMAKNVALYKNGKAINLPGQINQKANEWNLDSANTGMIAASLWVSDEFRSKEKTRSLGGTNASGVFFREFEKLPSAIENLRGFFNKSRIDDMLKNQYAPVVRGKIEKYLFYPFWGGSTTIRHERWDEQNPPDPFYPYPNDPIHKIGPTEKLYHDAAYDIFNNSLIISPSTNDFLSEVDRIISGVKKIMPFTLSNKKLRIWKEWDQNLFVLEDIFLDRVNYTETVLGLKTHIGIRLGLPCAFGLIGLLRAYIADLMARTLMVSFSNTILSIYENINGYMAVQLWEALTGEEVPAAAESAGALHRWLLLGTEGDLKAFREYPDRAWVKQVREEEAARKFFKKKLNAPLIKEREYKKKKFPIRFPKLAPDILFEDWHDSYLPYYPVITSGFYASVGLLGVKKNELLYGARLTAQAQIYIAFQLLKNGLKVLELDKDIDRRIKDGDTKHRRKLKNFSIGAGSYIWGGKKPPHYTHRHGINFDLSFGPNIQPWPDTILTGAIKKLKQVPKLKLDQNMSGKQLIDKIVNSDKEKYGFLKKNLSIVMICYTDKHAKAPNLRRKVVFKRIIQDAVDKEFNKVKQYCIKTINGEPFVSPDEEAAYQNAENELTGTPHFLSSEINSKHVPKEEITEPKDLQRTHIAHLSLMLIAPRTILFASPIVHLRAMKAIRQAFSMDGIYLFTVECPEDRVKELDSSHMNTVPETIRSIFQKHHVPLSEQAYVVVEENNGLWKIVDKENSYVIHNKEESLKASFIIPQVLLKLTAEIVRDTNYVFDPIKHYNHWHMDICDENYARILKNPMRWSRMVTSMSNIFDRYQELWLALGIELSPLIGYLQDYPISNRISSDFYHPFEEQQLLLEKCKKYINEHKRRFGDVLNKNTEHQTQNRTISEYIVNRLLRIYQLDTDNDYSEFINPTIDEEKINDAWDFQTLQEPIKRTREVIKLLKPHLLAHKILAEKDFTIFELDESDFIPDAPDEEMDDYEVRLA